MGIAAALGLLRGIYRTRGYQALVQALEDAIRAGMADGEAAALAVAASRQGHQGFDLEAAFAAAYDRLEGDATVTSLAHDMLTQMIDGAGGDLGRHLASQTGQDATYDDMLTGTWGCISGDQVRAPATWTDLAFWKGVGLGVLAAFQAAGLGSVSWKTGGPNPCAKCLENEAGSPYQIWAVPDFPAHPNCHCNLTTAESLPKRMFAAFLTGAATGAAASALGGAP